MDKRQANSSVETMSPPAGVEGVQCTTATLPAPGTVGDEKALQQALNGAVEAPKPRRPGRPKGSRNLDRLAIRKWIAPKARKLTLQQIRLAHKIMDEALAGGDVPQGRLDFVASVAKQAREYAHGKPVESKEISGPDGTPQQHQIAQGMAWLASLPDPDEKGGA